MIVAARRTPIATRARSLASFSADELAAAVIRAAVDDTASLLGGHVGIVDVVLGNCMGPGGNPARIAALRAGLGTSTPGVTLDRQCGSGLAAVIDAASAIRAGSVGARVAGGVESPSNAPVRSIDGRPYTRAPFVPSGWSDPDMLEAAENLAQHDGISRHRQDRHAQRSHNRARAARTAGRFMEELVPLGDGPSDDETVSQIKGLLPRMRPLIMGGTVTAGSATRISDGAAAVVLMPRPMVRGLRGLVVRGHAIIGCNPALPGIGAAPAILAALEDAGADVRDVAAFEIVEAFAAQSIAVLSRIGVADDDSRVCADGGALALGHPWGASGAIAVVRLFSRLVRGGAAEGTLGVAAASIGGGMGVAMAVEVSK